MGPTVKPQTRAKRDKAFQIAASILRQYPHWEEYIVPLARIRRTLYRPARWQSSLEIAVAAEFARRGYWLRPQTKINGHRVDFTLPRLNFALEVDGLRFHSDPATKRADHEQAKNMLRSGWNVYRMTEAEILEDLPRAVDNAIQAARERRSKFDSLRMAAKELGAEANTHMANPLRPAAYLMSWDDDHELMRISYPVQPVARKSKVGDITLKPSK